MISKLATFSGVSPTGEPLVRVFHKGDSIEKLAGRMMPEVQQWLSGYQPEKNKIAILVNALGSSEYWGQNINGDIFYEDALLHDCRKHPSKQHPTDDFTGKTVPPYGYWTFYNAHPFVHHRNKDPSRAFGKVVLACWNPIMHRVELIIMLDRDLAMQHGAQHIVDKIDAGEFPDVSMGCRVPFDICTICQHKSKTRSDYCPCITEFGMGKILDDGRRVGVINTYPRFFDISFVFIGADKTAKVMCKLGSLWVPSSVAEAYEVYNIPEGTDGLVKAACGAGSCRECAKGCTIKVAKVVTAEPRIAGVSLEESDRILKVGPNYGRTDDQDPDKKKGGVLKTNEEPHDELLEGQNITKNAGSELALKKFLARVRDEAAEKNLDIFAVAGDRKAGHGASIYSAHGPASAIRNARKAHVKWEKRHGMDPEHDWSKEASQWKIGPPPMPNREQYPFVGTINFRGLKIGVENAPGTWRTGKGWKTLMKVPYGEFLHNKAGGVDGDKLDVYVGPSKSCENVYIVHQNRVRGPEAGQYDEDKVMLGFDSPAQAKKTYLAHYDSDKFFRSMTIMAFPLFKRAIVGGEVDGEKVAQEMKKIAQDMRLEDLFAGHEKAGRREKTWKSGGKETKVYGSGMESSDKAKEASAKNVGHGHIFPRPDGVKARCCGPPRCRECAADKEKRDKEKRASAEAVKLATVMKVGFTPEELLKVSNDPKTASHLKWADIVKRIGPGRAVGKVSPLLSADEPSIPKETLNEMGKGGLEKGLSTSSLMGMVLKPREFQRACLCSMGKEPLADKMDDAGAVFKPVDGEMAPCSPLDAGHMDTGLLGKLLPLLLGKSYLGPPVRRRIIRITIIQPKPPEKDLELSSPILTKVGAAYNWYRREQMKLASDAMRTVVNTPELHAGIYGVGPEEMFGKTAGGIKETVNPATLGVLLGAIPLTLMYSAHQREKGRKGEDVGLVNRLVAEHPWLTTLAVGAGLREVMKSPQAQQAVIEAYRAGKRIWRGKG